MNTNEALQEALLHWFQKNCRDLPWRRSYNPYHIWISEIMLQQTQMERAVAYFTRWCRRFPDIPSLAQAREEEVFRLWEGLGYYSRARNILRTAALLMERHNGALPREHAALLALPGIGPYTAGAIMSLAFNSDHPLVDANVERLFARLFNLALPVKEGRTQAFIWRKAEELLPPGRARFFNQALMELGALLCQPRAPRCGHCPLGEHCEARRLRLTDQRPVAGKRQERMAISMVTGILWHRGRIFVQKRLEEEVWPGLWEFPGGVMEEGESPEEALVREYREETEFAIRPLAPVATIRHSYTKYRVTMHCFSCRLQSRSSRPVLHAAQAYRWLRPEELEELAFPAPHRRLLRLLRSSS
jgi:A/G-specific adenine glycosylase